MDKLTVYEVESAGSAGISLKNITLYRGPDGAMLDGYFERDAAGMWTYSGGFGASCVGVAGLRMPPLAGTALDEVLRHARTLPFELVGGGVAFFIDGLPSGRVAVIRSTPEDDDAPDLVRAHLPGYPLIGSNGPTMAAAAVGVLHSLRAHAADPAGWLHACAEDCHAEVERIQAGDGIDSGMVETEEMWEAMRNAYHNAARIVEVAAAAAKARTT